MSNYKEAAEVVPSIPWIPIFLLLAGIVLILLMVKWGFQYLKYIILNLQQITHKQKKKKKKKSHKYDDDDDESSSSSE